MVTGVVEGDVKEVEYVHYQCSVSKWKSNPDYFYNVFNLGYGDFLSTFTIGRVRKAKK